ncbi:MAG: SWIM zinc finger family protein [Minicystis sp.]
MSWYYDWAPRPTVAERAQKAKKQIAALEKKGTKLSPVVLEGRTIASTFWGKAWCHNLESYSDYENRIPRGRSYVRSGSVLDLQIAPGEVTALVQGTKLYKIKIAIRPVDPARWKSIVAACGGKIDSVVELLQGKLSKAVMEVITSKEKGLFPSPRQITMDCSCPDYASMCKHLAAVLYGIGARLDTQPEMLFKLRGADPLELVATAASGAVLGGRGPAKEKRLGADLASVFGIDLDMGEPGVTAPVSAKAAPKTKAAPRAKAAPKASSTTATSATQKPAPKRRRSATLAATKR